MNRYALPNPSPDSVRASRRPIASHAAALPPLTLAIALLAACSADNPNPPADDTSTDLSTDSSSDANTLDPPDVRRDDTLPRDVGTELGPTDAPGDPPIDDPTLEEPVVVPPFDCAALGRVSADSNSTCGPCTDDTDVSLTPVTCVSPLGEFDCTALEPATGDLSFGCGRETTLCRFDDRDCEAGCLEPFWIRVELDEKAVVGGVRFRSDWWNKRPDTFEVWVSNRPEDTPDQGATRVHSSRARQAPWQCVDGEPCGDDVPDQCCPNGPASTQVVPEGALWPRDDVARFVTNDVPGRFVWFRISSFQYPQQMVLLDLAFERADCRTPPPDPCEAACFDGVACEVVDGGARCGDCPSGYAGDGTTCVDQDGCADAPCAEGVRCIDNPAPDTGFSCGPCPQGTRGDGIVCVPDVCEPACEGWQTCAGGACAARRCNANGDCPGAACFLGTCTTESCQNRCARQFGAGHTWECVETTCRIMDCRSTSTCGAGQVCVSNPENPRGTFDQTCVRAGSTPCTAGCAGHQLCSASSGRCIP